MIKFKDLSGWLKAVVIIVWISTVYGLLIGFFGAL